MALQNVLANIPGLAGYLAQQQYDDQRAQSQLGQLLGVANLMEQQKQRAMQQQLQQAQLGEIARKTEQAKLLDETIAQLPEEVRSLARLNPQAFVTSLLKREETKVVPPGGVLTQGGREVYTNPRQEKDARTPFEKLLDAAGITEQGRRSQLIGQYLQKQSTHQPPVNVYSTNLQPALDAQGNPVLVQPSGRSDIPPRVVPGLKPMPGAGAETKSQTTRTLFSEYEAADKIIADMINSIQSGNRIGMVGLPGMAAQAVETVQGTINPRATSPAIDLRSQKEQLLDKMKALAVRKDSNVSNKDIERYEQILGFDRLLTTPGAAVRALTNVQNDLRRRRMNIDVRQKESASPPPGMIQEGYRFKGGDPSSSANWERVE